MTGKTFTTKNHEMELPTAGLETEDAEELPGGYVAIPAGDGSGWTVVDTLTKDRIDLTNKAIKELIGFI